jgi:diguanylate cyclase (GGDEF)-like protein
MTIFLTASAAALATTVLLVVGRLLARRSRRHDDQLVMDTVDRVDARLEGMVHDLAAALERAERENRRAHVLGELALSIELDEVMARTLEAARLLPGIDAARVSIATGSADVVADDGLTAQDESEPALAAAPEGRVPKLVRLSLADDGEETGDREGLLREGLVLPLTNGDESIGHLGAYSRNVGALEAARAELEELAERAAPILDNARRFREARQLADLDALTGLHNQRFFHETLAREVARARRYQRSLALMVLDLDDFKLINDRIGHLAGDSVLAATAERVRDAVRTADIACRVGGDEFAVILPESTLLDADQLYERVSNAVSSQPVGQGGLIRLSAGITELRPDDDALVLFQRADEALYRAKDAGKATVVAVAAALPPEDVEQLPDSAPG